MTCSIPGNGKRLSAWKSRALPGGDGLGGGWGWLLLENLGLWCTDSVWGPWCWPWPRCAG